MSGLTTHEMRLRVAARFGSTTTDPGQVTAGVPQHLVLFEVPVEGRKGHPESKARQRIDAVAVGMWAKTEHVVHGIEIKISRADLLRELRDLTKSESSVAACDYWWLALADVSLLKPTDVIPDGWGVLIAKGRGLHVLREPERREGVRDARFVAGLLMASMRSSTYRRSQGYLVGKADAERDYKARERKREAMEALIERAAAS